MSIEVGRNKGAAAAAAHHANELLFFTGYFLFVERPRRIILMAHQPA